jgi:alkylation response protein AidB-like acyl-CoA dehydrogenase
MNRDSLLSLLAALFAGPAAQLSRDLSTFCREHRARSDHNSLAFDRAALGGLHAATVGQAFVAGYRAALQQLVPSLGREPAALCVTEAQGAHPRAIQSTLTADGDAFVLRGSKRWVSVGESPVALLVVARVGEHADGRPSLRVARVPVDRAGVIVQWMSGYPVVPDVAHASIALDDVRVGRDELLDGDGYSGVVKPFRTIEDIHVFGAVLAYLVAVGRASRWPAAVLASLVAPIVALRSLAEQDPSAPSTHLALGATLDHAKAAVDALDARWDTVETARRDGWYRDRVLLQIASKARAERMSAAARALSLDE